MSENVLDHARELLARSEAATPGPLIYDKAGASVYSPQHRLLAGVAVLAYSKWHSAEPEMKMLATGYNHGPEVAAALLVAVEALQALERLAGLSDRNHATTTFLRGTLKAIGIEASE